jgi:hypothetical protein
LHAVDFLVLDEFRHPKVEDASKGTVPKKKRKK